MYFLHAVSSGPAWSGCNAKYHFISLSCFLILLYTTCGIEANLFTEIGVIVVDLSAQADTFFSESFTIRKGLQGTGPAAFF